MDNIVVILVTASSVEEANKLADVLVESQAAACVYIVPGIQSTYSWKGKICKDQECLLLIKAPAGNFELIRKKVKQLHSYDCPEILSISIKDCDPEYLTWLINSTSSG